MSAGFPLARWFTPARDISGADEGEFLREELIGDLHGNRLVAQRVDPVKGHQVIVLTARQTAIVESEDGLVWFDSVANDRWEHVRFWFNLSSVEDLLAELHAEARTEPGAFDQLFFGTQTKAA